MTNSTVPFPRERNLILGLLIALAAGGWPLVIRQSAMMSMSMPESLTMGLGAALFLAMWVAMMVAMMFPAAAPMILMFASVSAGKRHQGQAFVPTWVFVGGYLLVWIVFGALAYLAAAGVDRWVDQSAGWRESVARVGGLMIALAGVYQLTPLKRVCLSKCRTPIAFVLSSWHDGYGGAFRMGLEHGAYCLGCCWFLFVILFPLGVMNVPAMVLLTAVIFAERCSALARRSRGLPGWLCWSMVRSFSSSLVSSQRCSK